MALFPLYRILTAIWSTARVTPRATDFSSPTVVGQKYSTLSSSSSWIICSVFLEFRNLRSQVYNPLYLPHFTCVGRS